MQNSWVRRLAVWCIVLALSGLSGAAKISAEPTMPARAQVDPEVEVFKGFVNALRKLSEKAGDKARQAINAARKVGKRPPRKMARLGGALDSMVSLVLDADVYICSFWIQLFEKKYKELVLMAGDNPSLEEMEILQDFWELKNKIQKHCDPIIQDMDISTPSGGASELEETPPPQPCCQPEFNNWFYAGVWVKQLESQLEEAEGLARAAREYDEQHNKPGRADELRREIEDMTAKTADPRTPPSAKDVYRDRQADLETELDLLEHVEERKDRYEREAEEMRDLLRKAREAENKAQKVYEECLTHCDEKPKDQQVSHAPMNPVPPGSRLLVPQQVLAGAPMDMTVVGPDNRPLAGVAVQAGQEVVVTGTDGRAVLDTSPVAEVLVCRIRHLRGAVDLTSKVLSPPTKFPSGATCRLDGKGKYLMPGTEVSITGGPFDPHSADNRVRLGETPLRVLAASPVELVVAVPPDLKVGLRVPLTVETTGHGTAPPLPVTMISIRLEANKTRLRRGQSTQGRVVVMGTRDPVYIRITNETPDIISLKKGRTFVTRASGGRTNQVKIRITGQKLGDFIIEAMVLDL